MGGKRPDQYNIDPAEAGATDYKHMPQTGRGTSSLDDTIEMDRRKLASSEAKLEREATGAGTIPMPGAKPPPSIHTRSGTLDDDAPAGAADVETDPENPLV